jgi:hypothetical protein
MLEVCCGLREIYVVADHCGRMTANGQNKEQSQLMTDEILKRMMACVDLSDCQRREESTKRSQT